MSIFQLLSNGPGWAVMAKIALVISLMFSTTSFTDELVTFYESGPMAQALVAMGFGLCVPVCLNGIYEGFDRGNWIGLGYGLVGVWFLSKGALALFAPHYLGVLPF